MTRPNRKTAAVAITLAVTVLVAGSVAHAQSASETLVSAASLQSIQQQLNALRTQVTALQTSNAALQSEVGSLKTTNAALQGQLAAVRTNPALALGPFVSVDPNPEVGVAGPNVIFHGVNVHIVSGSGTTNDGGTALGLGGCRASAEAA